MKTAINISGFNVALSNLPKELLSGLPVDIFVRYNCLSGSFKDVDFCFLQQKDTSAALSPARLRKVANKVYSLLKRPIVFIFDTLPFYQRQRLIEQNVNFVVSGKYANLPNFFVNSLEPDSREKKSGKLSPVAQYILVYYLLHPHDELDSIANIQKVTPFSYLQISRALIDLEKFNLCSSKTIAGKGKQVSFNPDRKALWNDSLTYLRNPVKQTAFTDSDIKVESPIKQSGMNALAYHSDLNPVRQITLALNKKEFDAISENLTDINPVEGKTAIQEWIYPPVPFDNEEFVDPLSLWLSIKDKSNPRVEDALEQLIENIQW